MLFYRQSIYFTQSNIYFHILPFGYKIPLYKHILAHKSLKAPEYYIYLPHSKTNYAKIVCYNIDIL